LSAPSSGLFVLELNERAGRGAGEREDFEFVVLGMFGMCV